MSSRFDCQDPSHRERPLLSIIVPALVADRELDRCLASIELVCPDRSDVEVVIVVPTSAASDIARLYPHMRIVSETRRGIYSAMNDGARFSNGDYMYFIGKDDILLPPIKEALEILRNGQSPALYCDVYWGEVGTYSGRPSRWLILGRNVCHQGIIYSRTAFERHGPYLRRMKLQADHLLNLKILWDRDMSEPDYLARPLAWYSGSGYSVVKGADPVFWRLYPVVMRRYVGGWAAAGLVLYRKLRGVA